MNDLKQIIANNITTLRKVKNLTQLEFANELNYSDKAKDIYYNVIPDNYNPIIPYFDCWVLVEQ